MEAYLEAGRIINTHGVKGEVKLEPWSDEPDFLADFETVYIEGKAYRLLNVREYKRFAFLQLEGVDTVEKAMALREKKVCIAREDADLPEGVWFIQDMIGLDVFDRRQNRVIGRLEDVIEMPAGRLFSIGGGKILIPDRPEFFKGIDAERGQMIVETIRGMGDSEEQA